MDILYIIGKDCSKCNNNELRYSLRSIEKYGRGVGRVFVAGYCPEWLSDEAIKIPFEQPYKIPPMDDGRLSGLIKKHANILATILYVVDNTDIGDEFLVSMDDHIYIRATDFSNYPFYIKTEKFLPRSETSKYKRFLKNTRGLLQKQKLSYYYCCPHRNMHLSRRDINECRDFLDIIVSRPLPLEPFAYLINYRFSVHKDVEWVSIKDIKLEGGCEWWKADPNKTEVISTYDFEEGKGLDVLLNGMFNNKSKYEQ